MSYMHRYMPPHFLQRPACRVLCFVWSLSIFTLILTGNAELLPLLLQLFLVLGLSVLTIILTTHTPEAQEAVDSTYSKRWLQVQLTVFFAIFLFTGYRGMLFNHALSGTLAHLPGVSPLIVLLNTFPVSSVNPILYFVLPVCVLLLLQAHWRELGLRRGYRAGAVLGLWSIIPLVLISVNVASGRLTLGLLIISLFTNTLNNGFFEEFLFRGVLLTRLSRLLGTEWSVVLSSLLSGGRLYGDRT